MTGSLWPKLLTSIVRPLLFAGVVAGLAVVVALTAEEPEDWRELGVIALAVFAASMALRERARKAPRRNYRIHRSPESRW